MAPPPNGRQKAAATGAPPNTRTPLLNDLLRQVVDPIPEGGVVAALPIRPSGRAFRAKPIAPHARPATRLREQNRYAGPHTAGLTIRTSSLHLDLIPSPRGSDQRGPFPPTRHLLHGLWSGSDRRAATLHPDRLNTALFTPRRPTTRCTCSSPYASHVSRHGQESPNVRRT